jgi:hypothetical protein
LSLLFLGGCSHDYKLMRAEEHFNGYGTAIRWNLFKRALTYLSRPPRPVDWRYLKEVKVTGYRLEFQDLLPSNKVAMRTVEISYIPPGSVVETRLLDEQRWRFDDVQDRWLLETGLPKFIGMAGVSQPYPVAHGMPGQ